MARVLSGPRVLKITSAARDVAERDDEEPSEAESKTPGRSRPRGRKQVLVGFSKESRLNLALQLAQLATPDFPSHVTLTYADTFPHDREGIKAHVHALQEWCKYWDLWGLWRLEFQKRMAPHYHVMLFSPDEDSADTRLTALGKWWRKLTDNPSEQACFVTPGDLGKAAWYLALHNMKLDQSPPIPVGRWWGYVDRAKFKAAQRMDEIQYGLPPREIIWLKRLMRRKTGTRGSLGEQGFSWFLPQIQHRRVLEWARGVHLMEKPLPNPF